MKQVYREYSLSYRHDYEKNWLLLDVDLTGILAGKTAEGSEKGYFSGERNGRGRQVGRVYASQYDEIVIFFHKRTPKTRHLGRRYTL